MQGGEERNMERKGWRMWEKKATKRGRKGKELIRKEMKRRKEI